MLIILKISTASRVSRMHFFLAKPTSIEINDIRLLEFLRDEDKTVLLFTVLDIEKQNVIEVKALMQSVCVVKISQELGKCRCKS
jgi:hypothetical protein